MIELLGADQWRVGYLGACKSGKSFGCWMTVEELLAAGKVRWALMHDTVREVQYPPAVVAAQLPGAYPNIQLTTIREAGAALATHRRLVFRHPVAAGEVAALAMALRREHPGEGVAVVFDELDHETINCGGAWADQRVHDLYHHGRGIFILGCTQRVKGMPRGARGLHDVWFIYRLTREEADDLRPYGLPETVLGRIPRQQRGAFTPISLS